MTETLPLTERLRLVANVSDLMLNGSIYSYRPERPVSAAVIVHEKARALAA